MKTYRRVDVASGGEVLCGAEVAVGGDGAGQAGGAAHPAGRLDAPLVVHDDTARLLGGRGRELEGIRSDGKRETRK